MLSSAENKGGVKQYYAKRDISAEASGSLEGRGGSNLLRPPCPLGQSDKGQDENNGVIVTEDGTKCHCGTPKQTLTSPLGGLGERD